MSLPLLPVVFLGTAVVTGVSGAKKSVQAGIDHVNANALNEDSNERVVLAAASLDTERELCEKMLESLGESKMAVLTTSMKRFVESFEKIKNIDFHDSVGLDELKRLHVDKQTLADMQDSVAFAVNLLKGSTAGAMGGAMTAFGAYSAAGALATASTGTAIAGLSGAAAHNATLAFFGGGSLAAGGFGMAGGTVVLGGLIAGPALYVMGKMLSAKEGKNMEVALANAAEAEEICQQLKTAGAQCAIIRRRAALLFATLAKLDARFMPHVIQLQEIIDEEGVDYSRYCQASKEAVARVASLAVSVKAVIDIPLLDASGNLTMASKQFVEKELIALPGSRITQVGAAGEQQDVPSEQQNVPVERPKTVKRKVVVRRVVKQ